MSLFNSSLFKHPEFKKYFANISWLMAEKILRAIVNLFVGAYVARYLGPEQFGLLSYAVSFVFLFSPLIMLAHEGIIVRELVNSPEQRDTILGTSFWLKMMGAVLAFLALAGILPLTSNDFYTNLLIFFIAGGLFLQSFNVIDSYFQSKILSRNVVVPQICQLIISSLVKLFLIFIKAPLLWFALIFLLDNFILEIFLIFVYKKQHFSLSAWQFSCPMAKNILRMSLPLFFSGIFISIYMRIDQMMIKEMLGTRSVGTYAVAVTVCELWYFLPMIITSSFFPAILEAKKMNNNLYSSRIQRLYKLMVALSVGIAISLTILAKPIILLLFGEQYSPAIDVIKIYIWINIFVSLGVASGKWLLSEGLQIFSIYRTLLGAIINILMNFLLIPKLQLIGAAISALFSYFTATFIINLIPREDFRKNAILMYKAFFPFFKEH